jgi:phosphatidylinositol 4-kinase
LEDYFPRKSSTVIEEYRKRSIYRELKSWRIAHLMVKTGDDLKQGNFDLISEQFAMQLINNIANIFKK